jgi:hypothetical protein
VITRSKRAGNHKKEFFMKNAKKALGIAVIIAAIVFQLAGCASMTIVSVDSVDGPRQIGQYKDIDPKSITVNATYKDGSQKKVNSNTFSITFDNTKVGPQTVSINLGFNKYATFKTEVMALQSLSGPASSENKLVRQNYGIEKSLVKLYGIWDKIGKMEIPFSVSPITQYAGGAPMAPDARRDRVEGIDEVTVFDLGKLGAQTITAEYKGLKTSFDITVVPMTDIKIVRLPLKLEYKVGQELNNLYLVGMEVEGIWEGLPNKSLSVSVNNIRNYNKDKAGKQTLVFTANGKSATFEINVTE